MATTLANRAGYFAQLESQYGLPSGSLEAVMQAESSGNLNAVSRVGAQGPFQLMPGTARELGVTDSFNLEQSAEGAARYLQQNLKKFGSFESALAAYNWGPGNLSRKGFEAQPAETRNYITKVLNGMGASPSAGTQGIDVANTLLGQVQGLQGQANAATLDVMAAYGAAGQSTQKAAELARQSASHAASAALVTQQGELATQNARIQAADAFGTNVQSSTDVLTAMGIQMRQKGLELIAQQQRVNQLSANANLSNPLGLFADILFGAEERNKLAAIQSEFDTLGAVTQNLNAATQQTAQTQNAIKQTLNEASIASNAEALRLKSESDYQEAMAKVAGFKAQEANALRTANSQQIDDLIKLQQLQNSEESRDSQKDYRELLRLQLEERLEQNKATTAEREAALTSINLGRSQWGLAPMNQAEVNNYSRTAQGKAALATWSEAGISRAINPGSMSFGNSPVEAVASFDLFRAQAPVGSREIAELVGKTYRNVARSPNAPKKAEELNLETNRAVRESASAQLSEIRPGDADNIYRAPSLEVLKEANPPVASLPMTELLTLSGTELTDPSKVFAQAASAVGSKQVPFQTAVNDIVSLYKAAIATNNTVKNYSAFGLPNQGNYNAEVDLGGAERGVFRAVLPVAGVLGLADYPKELINLADPVQVGRALSIRMNVSSRLPGVRDLMRLTGNNSSQ